MRALRPAALVLSIGALLAGCAGPPVRIDDSLADEVAAGAGAASALVRTRVSPFTSEADVRIFLPDVAADDVDGIGSAADGALAAGWRALPFEPSAINLEVALVAQEPGSEIGDADAIDLAPVDEALDLGAVVGPNLLSVPADVLAERYGPWEGDS